MNDLPITLKSKKHGVFIENDFYCCPMQADDIDLLALTKTDLDKRGRHFLPSVTQCHHKALKVECSHCLRKVGEVFLSWVRPKTLK